MLYTMDLNKEFLDSPLNPDKIARRGSPEWIAAYKKQELWCKENEDRIISKMIEIEQSTSPS